MDENKSIIMDVPENIVNIIINDHTKNFNLWNPSDIIQSSLEFNNYLINKLNENRESMSKLQYEKCLNFIYENLINLSKNADKQIETMLSLKKSCKDEDINKKVNKNKKLYNKIDTMDMRNTGITITINKNILNKY